MVTANEDEAPGEHQSPYVAVGTTVRPTLLCLAEQVAEKLVEAAFRPFCILRTKDLWRRKVAVTGLGRAFFSTLLV
jgi:hypothetical protein